MGGNTSNRERRVFERLLRLHPKLRNGKLEQIDERALDGIVTVSGRRLGFQLTDLFTEGTTDEKGSTAARADEVWAELGPKVEAMLADIPDLNRASLTIRFRTNGHLHPDNLPRKNERVAFIEQLETFLRQHADVLDKTTKFGHELHPVQDQPLLERYIDEVFVSWRDLDVDSPPHLQVADLNHAIRMGADVMTEAFERKGPKLTRAVRTEVDARHRLDEMYLVLGGDPEGPRHTKQYSGDYPSLLHALTFMGYVLADTAFDGIVIFHDWGDAVSVFCTLCIRNHQALHNWRAEDTLDHLLAHRCAALKLRGPTTRFEGGEWRKCFVHVEDEARWIIRD